jgi:hypothetical protein
MGKFGVLRQNDAKRLGAKIGRHVPGGGIPRACPVRSVLGGE